MTKETRMAGRPRRTFELDVHVDGDTWSDVIRELTRMALHIEEHGPECRSVGGGYSTGHIVTVRHDSAMTGDTYRDQLDVYLSEPDQDDKGFQANPEGYDES